MPVVRIVLDTGKKYPSHRLNSPLSSSPSSPSQASYISVPFLKAFALVLDFLCDKFPDLPGSSVLEPFEPSKYGRQHVFDPLSPASSPFSRLSAVPPSVQDDDHGFASR
ncbi:hypothetical protein VN97_g7485 [Penicillium thymicola]|uniref:Uncharacterized protein n=1 Tax=Penicillium thymicola TaxID=293382 RepID=A0AAI9X7C2_PENTH|nr:hypothetical protein VN97_g7485 [Penicillium thymicola]